MRYITSEDGARPNWKIYCDGERVEKVYALDTDEGWVEAWCLDGHTGHDGSIHINPETGGPCSVRLEGKVTVDTDT